MYRIGLLLLIRKKIAGISDWDKGIQEILDKKYENIKLDFSVVDYLKSLVNSRYGKILSEDDKEEAIDWVCMYLFMPKALSRRMEETRPITPILESPAVTKLMKNEDNPSTAFSKFIKSVLPKTLANYIRENNKRKDISLDTIEHKPHKRKKDLQLTDKDISNMQNTFNIDEEIIAKETLKNFLELLKKKDEINYQIVTLKLDNPGMSWIEVSKEIGLKQSAISQRVTKIKKLFETFNKRQSRIAKVLYFLRNR